MMSRRARPVLWPPPSCSALRRPRRRPFPRCPCRCPATRARPGVDADRATWIVGARPGAARSGWPARTARASLGTPGAYVIPRARARAFADALAARHRLVYAQPDVLRATRQTARAFGNDPLDDLGGYRWRDHVVSPNPTAGPPKLIALVDATLDRTHPEFAPEMLP